MKGFKPTGYGPSAGFKFPAQFGFTGSTGAYTNVQPYVRRKAFANGGYVSKTIGDQGSALVRRKRSYSALDQESGGKTPLRPGYAHGGMMSKALMQKAVGRAKQGALSQAAPPPPVKRVPPARVIRSRFYADGGKVKKKPEYPKPSYWQAVKDRIRETISDEVTTNSGMTGKAARELSGRQRRIDEASNYSRGGKATRMGYARGGDVKKKRRDGC
jgi:hypothetical protein